MLANFNFVSPFLAISAFLCTEAQRSNSSKIWPWGSLALCAYSSSLHRILRKMLLLFFLTVLAHSSVDCETINPNSYDIVSPPEIYHNLQNIFDDDLDSSSNIYIQNNRSFTLAIELQKECLIQSVSVYSKDNFLGTSLYKISKL